MSDRTPFESNPRKLRCEEWEALLADALDGALTTRDQASFERHAAECPLCVTMLAEAQKGQQWLQFLHPEPPIPADLLQRILVKTAGTAALGADPATSPALPLPAAVHHRTPAWQRFSLPAGVRRYIEPRMMMTAAMAFFSIAMTLNLAGVRLTALRGQDLRPSAMFSNLERQFYTAKAPVVRYYENLRVVYEVESRMRELRRTTESDETKTPPQTEQQKAPAANENGGSARKNGGKSETPRTVTPPASFAGRPIEARLQDLPEGHNRLYTHEVQQNSLFPPRADQAERSLA
ncbi:MAG TPA: anti-sigma factor [Acidisarcina sp.]|nr:anti-sigma factor [Acidisarcina sp.]